MYSAKGKLEKKAVFSPHCEDETTICYDTAFRKTGKSVNRDSISAKVLGEDGVGLGEGKGSLLKKAPLPLPEPLPFPAKTLTGGEAAQQEFRCLERRLKGICEAYFSESCPLGDVGFVIRRGCPSPQYGNNAAFSFVSS